MPNLKNTLATLPRAATLVKSPRVGHAFFARDGVKLAFGRRWDGRIIHISESARGGACGCTCPADTCGRKLIAHKPESDITHHFAHAPLTASEHAAGISPNCESGHKTALHVYAQQVLNDTKTVVLGPLTVSHGGRTRVVLEGGPYTFDAAQLEKMDGETIPDVILYKGDYRIHVEIYVTHRCGAEKRAKIVAANISAIEIDLSGLPRDITLPGLPEQILTLAPRDWIHNRKAKRIWDELEAERRLDVELHKKRRAKEVKDLRRDYAVARRHALAAVGDQDDAVVAMIADKHGALLQGPEGKEGYFNVHPNVWKAHTVRKMATGYLTGITPEEIVRDFRRCGWIIERFYQMADMQDSVMSEAGLPEGGPEGAVREYLDFLAAKKVVENTHWGWHLTAAHAAEIARIASNRRLAVREAAARTARRRELAALACSIAAFDDGEFGSIFSVDIWMEHRPKDGGLLPGQVADEGGSSWHILKQELVNTLAVLRDESEKPAVDFDLPVTGPLARMRVVHEARAEERARVDQEAARLASVERSSTILRTAEMLLDTNQLNWMDTPHPLLEGLSPRAAAELSAEGLANATVLVRELARKIAEKAKWVEELERQAQALLRSTDKKAAYMVGPDPSLPRAFPA
jgi:hypothetical protein